MLIPLCILSQDGSFINHKTSFMPTHRKMRKIVYNVSVHFCHQEIGDVENWARSIERDMHTISNALEYAYKGDS